MALARDLSTPSIALSFEDFLVRYGDDSRYELSDGELFDLEPTGSHVRAALSQTIQVAATLARWLNHHIVQQGADYFIPHRGLIKPLASQTGFRPDVIVLDRAALSQEPLWASPLSPLAARCFECRGAL